MTTITRRALITTGTAAWLTGPLALSRSVAAQSAADYQQDSSSGVSRYFPAADPNDVQNIVGLAHFDVEKVRAIVTKRPALAKASWDWGFGDWESALGAASHMGRRDIADVLIEHGARPNLFTFAMFGQLDAVKAIITANPGIQKIHGPHGITLLRHAEMGGDAAKDVFDYLDSLGDAGIREPSRPLEDGATEQYLGTYEMNAPEENLLNVTTMNNGSLGIARGDRNGRRLNWLGDHSFAPSGGPAVRVDFVVENNQAVRVTIHDGELIVSAKRIN